MFNILSMIVEWTGTLLKYMKEQLCKPLTDYYTSTTATTMNDEQKLSLRQWQYCANLVKHMYQVRCGFLIVHFLIGIFSCLFTEKYMFPKLMVIFNVLSVPGGFARASGDYSVDPGVVRAAAEVNFLI